MFVKPINGLLDATSKTTKGINSLVTYFDDKPNHLRVRPVRAFYGETFYIKRYSLEDARLVYLLKNYYNKKFKED